MANQLRIARLDPTPYQPVADRPDTAKHRRLDAVLRRHLPPVTASLLAEPRPAGGGLIEWYSDLAGQPVAMAALPNAAQEQARTLLADRLMSITALAERLSGADSANVTLGAELRGATSFPGEETVYVVGGQPVITFWGHRPLAPPQVAPAAPSPAPPAAAAAVGASWPSAARLRRLWLLPGLLLLLAMVTAGLVRWSDLRWPPWGPDYGALTTLAKDEEDALERRLDYLRGTLDRMIADCRRKAEEEKKREQMLRLANTAACITAEGSVPPLDIYFLQDLTGSFVDDLPNMIGLVSDLVARVGNGEFAGDVRFGVGSFMDKPHRVFGTRYTYVYKNHLDLTHDGTALVAAVRDLRVVMGGDEPEAQYEALIEITAAADTIGFREDARRFVVVLTDAEPHVAGDWAPGPSGGAPRRSSGKGHVGPLDEDYPSPEQVMAALQSVSITPIFLVSGPSIGVYQDFVGAFRRGVSLPLLADSANVFDALFEGLRQACKQ